MEINHKITLESAEHYQWGKQCDGWHLLKSDDLSVIREKMPLGTSEALHFHHRSQQLFYIVSGEAFFEIDGKSVLLRSGESIHVPPGIIHRISNNSEEDLHFLVISSPKSHGDRENV